MVIASPRGKEMLDYLPRRLYEDSAFMHAHLEAIGGEHDLLRAAIDSMILQWFARTATWSLDRWEDLLGLESAPSLTDAERQDRIVSHLRGVGTVTKALIKSVAESYAYGTVDVKDINDNPGAALPDYTIRITFIDDSGIPSNFTDLQQAIDEAIPAHLAVTYEFTFNTWSDLDAQGWTWDQLDGTAPGGPAGAPLTWDDFENLDL